MEQQHSRLSLILGLSIPALIIIIVAAVVFIPRFLNHPKVDFVYLEGSQYIYGPYTAYDSINNCFYPSIDYTVVNNKLTKTLNEGGKPRYYSSDARSCASIPRSELKPSSVVEQIPKFYRYDVKKEEATLISFSDAEALILDPSAKSPDGYTIDAPRYDNGIIIDILGSYHGDRRYTLSGHGATYPIKTDSSLDSRYSYQNEFRFLGWVITQ